MANWATVGRLGNPADADWQKQNLVWIEPVSGQRWQVNRNAAPAFEGLLKELAQSGYPLKSSGGFNYRNIRGGSKLSQHAFGTAIDLNAETNPMLSRGQKVATDLPPNIAEIAAKNGLEWGGNWRRPDAMHFEWKGGEIAPAPPPGKVGGDGMVARNFDPEVAAQTNTPLFGSMSPGGQQPAPEMAGKFPDFVENSLPGGSGQKSFADRLKASGKAFEDIPQPTAPRPTAFPGGPSAEQAQALLKLMQNPSALAQSFLSRRIG